MFKRSSGVLMHISSLPSPYGIGSLGKQAFEFIDFLKAAGQRYWQVLPLGHTGFGDSPYQCFSAAAGNYYFIDLDLLIEAGLLTEHEVRQTSFAHTSDKVDFNLLAETRMPLLRRAFARINAKTAEEIKEFRQQNSLWLEDYALFMALKEERFEGKPLWDWPDVQIRSRIPAALAAARHTLAEEIDFRIFMQYLFFSQWRVLRAYAHENGIQIIGDIPIYVSADSSDVWQHPTLFKVDADYKPRKVAGVPPDYYSETGQLWGNPVYDWPAHEMQNYAWWIWRVQSNMELFDVIRIDHFRGLESYWEVDADAENAIRGRWCKGPRMKLLHALNAALDTPCFIAEDLGVITDEVRLFLEESGLPGMKVMIFGFDAEKDNEHLPHSYPQNLVAYTSTHDSQSICEQIMDICTEPERQFAYRYLRSSTSEALGWSAIKSLWASPAHIAMTTMQDVLSLGADARMNIPATLGGNWAWRVRQAGINDHVAGILREITTTYKRFCPYKPATAKPEDAQHEQENS